MICIYRKELEKEDKNSILWGPNSEKAKIIFVEEKTKDGEENKYKPYQKYFGRGLLFVIISLFQTLIITLGDMYVLGTQATSPYRFVIYALLISLLFSSIIIQ